MASPKMSLKLLVDVKGSRVLFAEVPKEFVDFLFHIFSLPMGTLIESLGSNQMVGCLGKLKESIDSIKVEDEFNPITAFNGDIFQLCFYHASPKKQSVYRCANAAKKVYNDDYDYNFKYGNNKACQSNVTLYVNSICPDCIGFMNVPMTVVMPEVAETNEAKKARYEKEAVSYVVMDNLEVKPIMSTVSTISSITLISKFGVKDLSQLEEKTVTFGKDEGLKLLMASLKTDKVLTSIFLD
ncbi:hypothetical protein HanRHA438_Chr08g0343661 [Helianthus annuus]|nr:hypothetical protein HanHA300_Chr08g0274481 [Helianthus annuus]KAJ0546269.1 hypothetical protein HanIR_Chr08g0358971 [Helianthus annuus]KAJ0553024.1 hypothetical protein HanHA89_Chr08g0291731 [Helianthus annuus]KAJ0721946.1 hypothetical protein HanOQP8_Chr08g0281101 [Helianthus annuus]KAJ0897259.1 hypothetical protein HanRHA438_Chr08g0343661 [Helianthus annuus]